MKTNALYALIECNMETVKYLGVTFKLNDSLQHHSIHTSRI